MVRLTPNGLDVIVRHRRISFLKSSGVGCVNPVKIPNPPALETAEAISAYPTYCMPPQMIGCSMPRMSVSAVFSTILVVVF